MVAVAREIFRDLGPDGPVALCCPVVVRRRLPHPGGVSGSAVVVDVENDVQILVHAPVHHFIHRGHVAGVDLVVLIDPLGPAHREADSLKARLLHPADEKRVQVVIVPAQLVIPGIPLGYPGADAVKAVAQVVAQAHVPHQLLGRDIPHGPIFPIALSIGRKGQARRRAAHCQRGRQGNRDRPLCHAPSAAFLPHIPQYAHLYLPLSSIFISSHQARKDLAKCSHYTILSNFTNT